jgi:DNA-binding MarR family transcriptional regulator
MNTWIVVDGLIRAIDEAYKRQADTFGLPVIEFQVLLALLCKEGQHATELATAVGRAATSFTPNLDKLVEKGFIERRDDASDRRAIRLFLTPEGERLRHQLLTAAEAAEGEASSILATWQDARREQPTAALTGVPAQG